MRILKPTVDLIVILTLIGISTSTCSLGGGVDPSDYRYENPVEYFLYVPEGYSTDRNWPLFIGIHGHGGTGRDCWSMWQPYAESEGFILLCPSIADASGGWYQSAGEAVVVALIKQIDWEYSIKPRIFMAGFSAGAQFVQGFAFNYPYTAGGVAVLSSGNYYPPDSAASSVPFLIVMGDRDNSVSIEQAKVFASLLLQNGNPVEFYFLPGVGHSLTREHKDLTIGFYRRTVGLGN